MQLNHGERKLQEIELNKLIIEALTHLKTLRHIRDYELYSAVPNFRRIRRVDAYCQQERRSARSSRSAQWLELQKNTRRKTEV